MKLWRSLFVWALLFLPGNQVSGQKTNKTVLDIPEIFPTDRKPDDADVEYYIMGCPNGYYHQCEVIGYLLCALSLFILAYVVGKTIKVVAKYRYLRSRGEGQVVYGLDHKHSLKLYVPTSFSISVGRTTTRRD